MSGAINEKIRERVNKLLAMANDPSSPNEAGVALQMASKLMVEHGLNHIDLKKAELKVTKVSSVFSVSQPKDYENWLALTCADAFGCHFYWSGGHPGKQWTFGKWWFVGRPDQIALAEHFMLVLQRAMYKGRVDFVKKFAGEPAKVKTAEGNGYCKGFVIAVRKNLVPVEKPEKSVCDAVVGARENGVETQKSKAGALGEWAGYQDGLKQGLHRPMTSEDKARLASS